MTRSEQTFLAWRQWNTRLYSLSILLKLLYAGILKASERWTHPIQNWNLTLSQLTIHFLDRLDGYISL